MKRLQFESLESRRALSTTPLDILPGPAGSNAYVLGTLGKTIVAEARIPECPVNRCLVAIDAIDHSVTVLTDPPMSVGSVAVQEQGRLVIKGYGKSVWITDGTVEGTRRISSFETFMESDGRAYWSISSSTGGNLKGVTVWNTDGEVARSVEIPWYCTDFDGCDFVSLIGVVDQQPYFQTSDVRKGFGEMRVYRGTDLLFAQDFSGVPFSPVFTVAELEGTIVFPFQNPHSGMTDSQGQAITSELNEIIYSDDGNVAWFVGRDNKASQYQPSVGLIDLGSHAAMNAAIASYNQQHPVVDPNDPYGLDLPNMITFNECGYAVLLSNTAETGQELAIWTPLVGDSNFDNVFDSSDLIEVFQAGFYETGVDAVWGDGDWNFDGKFDSSDLIAAFQAGGYR